MIATRKPSLSASGKNKRLKKGQRLIRDLDIDDNNTEENSDEQRGTKRKKVKRAISSDNDEDIQANANLSMSSTKQFFLSEKIGGKGFRKSFKLSQGRANITPEISDLDSFFKHSQKLDPFEPTRVKLIENYKERYNEWLFHTLHDANILLYGIGRKTDFLMEFSDLLSGQDVIFLDGNRMGHDYNESDKLIKILIDHICQSIIKKPEILDRYSNITMALSEITDELNANYSRYLPSCDPFRGFLSTNFPDIYAMKPRQYVRRDGSLDLNQEYSSTAKDFHESADYEDYLNITIEDGDKSLQNDTQIYPTKRTVVPVLTSMTHSINRTKFAKSAWKGRYRHEHPKFYILIDNIEGPALRNHFSQLCISYLAACDAVSIIATSEHLNTTTLWSTDMLGRFNWHFEHVPTFEQYPLPGSFVLYPSKASISEGLTNKSSLDSLLTSITVKHRELLELIAKETMMPSETGTANSSKSSSSAATKSDPPGIQLNRILSGCKAKLILRTDKELKNMLKELIDQKTVKVVNDYVFMPSMLAQDILSKLQKQL